MSKASKLVTELTSEIARIEAETKFIELDDYVWCGTFRCTHRADAPNCVGEYHTPIYIKDKKFERKPKV